MWSKADVVGGDSSIPKKPTSSSPPVPRSPRKNGKFALSDAVINSDNTNQSTGSASDESRFSDSEDDE